MKSRTLLLLALIAALGGCEVDGQPLAPGAPNAAAATAPASDGPTEAEVRQIVGDAFKAVYQESYMTDAEFSIAFKDIQFAPKTQKNLFGGYYDQPIDVWPMRMNVDIAWRRGEEVRSWQRGTQNKEAFSFYKDEVGAWNFRTSMF